MYKIIYEIKFQDASGRVGVTPDYFLGFKTTDPSGDTMQQKEMMGKMSFEMKNPQYKAISVKVVAEGYV